jgi:hypothetical protein
MADINETPTADTPAPVPVASAPPTPKPGGNFWKRELNGATFLSLEHVLHMVLVVVVAGLVAAGMTTAFSMWTSSSAAGSASYLPGLNASFISAQAAVGIVAALLVSVPMLVVLDRRTRAEWLKRSGYSGRVAYKVPVYAALGTLLAGKAVAYVTMVSVVLSSLLMVGAPQATDIGMMYLTQFVPALLSALVFGAAAFYVFKLAKGRDAGRQFSMGAVFVSLALVVALLITAFNVLRATPPAPSPDDYFKDFDNSQLEDLFNY